VRRVDRRVGLCGDCAHVRIVRSARGSEFYMCRLADAGETSADGAGARFTKYPRLPVLSCAGYAPQDQGKRG
jgi:hypothetical protein